MQKKVKIQVQTHIQQGLEKQNLNTKVMGVLSKVKGTYYLRYKETLEGLSTPIQSTIKISENGEVSIIRAGDVRTKLMFVKGKTTQTTYQTPMGTMYLEVNTHHLSFTLSEDLTEGNVSIQYELSDESDSLGNYKIELSFKEE